MTDTLVTTIEQRRSGARVIKFAGVLDEHNRLAELTEKVGAGIALLNLSGVERVNSIGARDWIDWIGRLEAKKIQPVLIACSPAVVAQLNRIKNFAGQAPVKSFQVPYHCAPCAVDKLLLVHIADLDGPPRNAPECLCDACGQPMEFTDESGTYFAFISHLPPPKPEPAPEPALAKGSRKSITTEHVSRISKPSLLLRDSRPSLSAFQVPEAKRPSEHTLPMPRARSFGDRPLLFALVTVLLCTVAVLAVMLIS